MNEAKIRILIGCPTFGLDPNPKRWLWSLATAINDLHRRGIPCSFCFPYRKKIHEADNQIVRIGLTEKFTHILRMDDDIWGIEKGDVYKLLDADKEFISGVMYTAGFPYARCACTKIDKTKTLQFIEKNVGDYLKEVSGDGVQPCDLTATPFTLWKTSLFDKLTPPYFDHKDECSPDAVFCQKCLDNGIQPFVHMDIQLNHREVTPWNRLHLFNSDARKMLMLGQLDPTSKLYEELVEMFGKDGKKDLMMLKGTVQHE